jgi:hypothetical protein
LNWLLAGSSELALRFWPLIMGCTALYFMFRLLVEQTGHSIPALMLLWLFAFSQVYIRYATEVKQYSTDMAVSTVLIWSVLQYPLRQRRYRWALIGSITIWLSMPSVFVLAGIGMYWLYLYLKKAPDVSLRRIIPTIGSWLIAFGLYYALILHHDVGRPGLLAYHQTHFWPLWPADPADWQRLWMLTRSLISTLCGHTFPAVAFALIGLTAGIRALWTGKNAVLILLLVPLILCLLASGLGKYSLMERLTLFLMPLLALLMGIGLHFIWQNAPSWGRGLIIGIFLLVLPLQKGLEYFLYPLEQEEMRPLLRALETRLEEGDYLWIDHNARPAFLWYQHYHSLDLKQINEVETILNNWNGRAIEEISSKGEKKAVWLLFSHLVSGHDRGEMRQDLEEMQKMYGPPTAELHYRGAAAYKFRWRSGK